MRNFRWCSLLVFLAFPCLGAHLNYEFDSEHDAKYVFSAKGINEAGQKAVQTADQYIQELGDAKSPYARDFFRSSFEHGVDTQEYDLVEAYRTELILKEVHQNLEDQHPGKTLRAPSWIWNNVGGIWGRLQILYCSPTEYIALFGTQLPQQGFSGTYRFMDVWDVMLTGKMHSYSADPSVAFPVSYLPGDASLLRKTESRHYDMDRFSYMVDYGRGIIPASFYRGIIAPFLFSSHDSYSLRKQLGDCGYSVLSNWGRAISGRG